MCVCVCVCGRHNHEERGGRVGWGGEKFPLIFKAKSLASPKGCSLEGNYTIKAKKRLRIVITHFIW